MFAERSLCSVGSWLLEWNEFALQSRPRAADWVEAHEDDRGFVREYQVGGRTSVQEGTGRAQMKLWRLA